MEKDLEKQSPIQLVETIVRALDLLSKNAACLGRGNQIDIIEAEKKMRDVKHQIDIEDRSGWGM